MKQCRSEGELRAYLDRELPAEEAGRVAAHLAECETCAAAVEGLAARAQWVSARLDELVPIGVEHVRPRVGHVRPLPRENAIAWRRSIPAAVALAACLAMAYVMIPKRGRVTERPAAASPAPIAAAPVPAPAVQPVAQASRPARPRRRTPPRKPEIEYFLALDDEPFEVGVVRRVALGPAEIPADVVFSPDGRARAIRLVNYAGN